MGTHLKFISLPREVMRNIASFLPPTSALQLLLVSRLVCQTCDDWTVWRRVVNNDLNDALETTGQAVGSRKIWKKLVIASSEAYRSGLGRNFVVWLPQLLAHHSKPPTFQDTNH